MKELRMKRILLFAGLLALLTSCRPEISLVDGTFRSSQAELTGSGATATMLFSSEEGTATVDLEATKKWSASVVNDRASSWFKLSASEGGRGTVTLTITVSANRDYDERSASVVFKCGDAEQTLVVVQKQKDALLLTSGRVEMSAGGGTTLVSVSSNISYTYRVDDSAKDWLSASRTKGMATSSFQLTAAANESLDPRQGTVVISSQLGEKTVLVYQLGESPMLVISEHKLEMDPQGGEFSVQVTSNLDVSVGTADGCTWVQEVSTKTVSTNTYYFSVERNDSRSQRTGKLIFRNTERGMSDTVTVKQRFQPILVNKDKVIMPSRSADLVLLTAPGKPDDFKVSSSVSWLTVQGIEPDTDCCRIVLQSTDNGSSKARSGVVRVYYDSFKDPDEVTVNQAAQQASFSYTTTQREVQVPSFAQKGDGFVLWGDGSFDYYDTFVGNAKEGVHVYTDGVPSHTVTVESGAIPWLLVKEPENGMHFNFKTLKSKEN